MVRAPEPTLRPAVVSDAAGIARVHVKSWRETYAGILPDALLDSLSKPDRTLRWAAMLSQTISPDRLNVIVAENHGRIVGFLATCAQRDPVLAGAGFTGEIGSIYVLARAQGQGLGRALMRSGAQVLSEQGYRSTSLWVLKDNLPARHFYEVLGGKLVGEKTDMRDGMVLHELAYGWSDLTQLIGSGQE